MGFRTNSYATIWEIKPISETFTKARISVSRKDKQSGEYVTDFSGYVDFVGSACASKAALLSAKDRIKLGDVDVTIKYDPNKRVEYTNFRIYNFTEETQSNKNTPQTVDEEAAIEDIIEEVSENKLPF